MVKQEKERRKVQISGKSSCMVALPKKWIREMGMERGSVVTMTRLNSRSLLVSAQPDEFQGSGPEALIAVDGDDRSETIFRKIVSLYVLGYSRILIEGSKGYLSPAKRLSLKEMVRRHFIGTEGVAESRDRLSIHVLLGYSELSVEGALKKMLLIADSLLKDSVQTLESGDMTLADATLDREDEVGRFCLYVIRQLNLSLNQGVLPDLRLENRDTLGYILVARMLERIASHSASLSSAIGSLHRPMEVETTAKLAALCESARSLVNEALLSLFKRDHRGADLTIERSRALVDRITEATKLLDIKDGQDYYTLHSMMDSVRRVAEYAREVAEVVLDMTVERTLQEQERAVAQVVHA